MTHKLANSGFRHIPMPVTRMLTPMTLTEIGSAPMGKLSNRIRKRLASLSVIKLSPTIEPDRIAPGIPQVCRDPRSCGGRVSPGCSSALDLPASTGPGSKLVYAASSFIGNSSPDTMIPGAGGRYPTRCAAGSSVVDAPPLDEPPWGNLSSHQRSSVEVDSRVPQGSSCERLKAELCLEGTASSGS
jgi:hypothetical protein